MGYRDDATYKALENIIKNAGIKIMYGKVPPDSIDGEIWARSCPEAESILMPDTEEFDNPDRACLILGHEMGHILSDLDSPDDVSNRVKNEAICDLIGVYLTKLAEMSAGYAAELELINYKDESM